MPITVVSPTPLYTIGPGAGFILHTGFVGPFATGTTWRIEVHPHADETNAAVVITAPLWASDNHERRVWINMDPDGGQTTSYASYVTLATGQSVDLVSQLLAPDGVTVLDSGSETTVWDTDSSGRERLPVATTGLTTEQADQLAQVDLMVAPPFTTTTGVAIPAAAGQLVTAPAGKFFGIDTSVHTLTGSGTIVIPSLLGLPTAWGCVLDVTSAPEGWGRKPGYVDSFNFRIGQFLLLQAAFNPEGLMVVAEYRLHLEHFTWLWPDVWAGLIAYYIDPPCEVQLRFVTAFSP